MEPVSDEKKKTKQRTRRKKSVSADTGKLPGSLVASPDSVAPRVQVIAFNQEEMIEKELSDLNEINSILEKWQVTWVNIDGLGDVHTIGIIGQIFGLHPLALEDVLNPHQRSKLEQFADHYFFVIHMPRLAEELETEQVSIFFGRKFVVTFQEDIPHDCFDAVRQRIRKNRGLLHKYKADYLAYSLIDAVIDAYFPVLESCGEQLDEVEQGILLQPGRGIISRIHDIKRALLILRRTIWPQREAVNMLLREPIDFIEEETKFHLRDCYDHLVRLIDLIETYRERAADLMDLNFSTISNQMNEVIKVLTIMSTIFIPLTFISSIYGMNFNTEMSPLNMPELKWYFGYPFSLLLMFVIAVAMIVFFRLRGWIGSKDVKEPQPLKHSPPLE